ncbi:PIN domain-containing protein [Tsukamurella paurometabola]|uniref:PIN domain-containing protein n=1 Tax=Tsukamurella paurometabola TaxID=2061 RepID=A0ABS5NA59_TSUPA|nr:PIN domain-containing protein [Tsukamurella paurometabola]
MTDSPLVAVDTSVSVPLLFSEHEHHAAVATWARGRRLTLSGHALAETYSVLTRLPGERRLAPDDAVATIDDSFPLQLIPAARNIAGGAVRTRSTYDRVGVTTMFIPT